MNGASWQRQLMLQVLALCLAWCSPALSSGKALDLTGYTDETGAITVQRHGETVDPYFALQALLLAKAHGLDTSAVATDWLNWLATRYEASARLDRHCKRNSTWWSCKSADADDASLALWLAFLQTQAPVAQQTARISTLKQQARRSLQALQDRRTGLYRVSAQIPHSLFMDNLEVWSVRPTPRLTRAIFHTFWDAQLQIFKVTTQTDHPHPMAVFYPDAAAQLYPLLVKFPRIPGGAPALYKRWIARHRHTWLSQMPTDFAWGLLALVAWEQGDSETVHCWQERAAPLRHGLHWTVTDEVVFQIVAPFSSSPSSPTSQEDCT